MAHNLKIEKAPNMRIIVKDEVGGKIQAQSVEAVLLFGILEKLEEIHCGIIDVESAVDEEHKEEMINYAHEVLEGDAKEIDVTICTRKSGVDIRDILGANTK